MFIFFSIFRISHLQTYDFFQPELLNGLKKIRSGNGHDGIQRVVNRYGTIKLKEYRLRCTRDAFPQARCWLGSRQCEPFANKACTDATGRFLRQY